MRIPCSLVLLLAAAPVFAQTQASWFSEAQLRRPEMQKAMESLNEAAIVDEWIKLTEIPAPSGKEQARASYVRAELQKLGLADIRVDEMSNVSGIRKGTGGGPTVVFAAHLDTVFPEATDVKVKRDGSILHAPGIGDDTGNVIALLETLRALNRAAIKTKGDLVFLASTQEELGLKGAKHWLTHSGYRPDMFIALDTSSNEVWYGALRIDLFKFFYTSPATHTLFSRGMPGSSRAVAKAITAMYELPLPQLASGVGEVRLPTINVGMLGGGTAVNSIPAEAWFTVDLRSLDTPTQDRLRTAVINTARKIADQEHVGFRVEHTVESENYSKALSQQDRLNHPLVRTAVATGNHFKKAGTPAIVPLDLGSTDANIAISLGIPAIAAGATIGSHPHQLEETAEVDSIVPGIKSLIALAMALSTH